MNLNKNISDFSGKLRQPEILPLLQKYILWRKGLIDIKELIDQAPISINLDPTTACNFNCPYCVDKKIIKTGKVLSIGEINNYLENLKMKGLKSVILIGGGEPLLHPQIKDIISLIKEYDMQLAIVTNGVFLNKIYSSVKLMKKPDYIRLSVDAGSDELFKEMHQTKVNLDDVLLSASRIKDINSEVSLGYSYVIDWKNNQSMLDIVNAAIKAEKYGFDYISYKPCMDKMEDYEILNNPKSEELSIIQSQILLAKRVTSIQIATSENLRALFNHETDIYKNQPSTCHVSFFRSVLSPIGIFNCPAFRGSDFAQMADIYKGRLELINIFNPQEHCKDVVCFYHTVNDYIEELIKSDNIIELKEENISNFFL